MQELHDVIPGVGVFLFTVWVIVRASPQPVLGIIEHAAWAFSFNFIPVLVEPNPVWNHVTKYLQKGAFVPVRHLFVLQISSDVIPVKSNALVDMPGFQQKLLVSLIRDAVEVVDYILAEHGW